MQGFIRWRTGSEGAETLGLTAESEVGESRMTLCTWGTGGPVAQVTGLEAHCGHWDGSASPG